MEFVIEKGIPFPEKAKPKYPFDLMEVGDSFFVPGEVAWKIARPKYGTGAFKFRTMREDGVPTGTRVWRTA